MSFRRSAHDLAPTPWWLLVALTLVALGVRSIGLNDQLWYDEIRTLIDSVRHPLARIITVYSGDNQHTFYSVLAHVSIGVFGDHPWSLRLPAMLFGAGTIPVLFLFAREVTGRTEALLASLTLTFSYHHVWFSQSARGYTALAFCTLLSSLLLVRGARRPTRSVFVAYAVVAALGVYTHVTMVFVVASHALLYALPQLHDHVPHVTRQWRLPATGFVLAALFTLLLYSPVLMAMRQAVTVNSPATRGATPVWGLAELLRGLQIGVGGAIGVSVGVALFAVGAWSYYRQSKFVLGVFVVPPAITVLAVIALRRPVRPRFVLFAVGFGVLFVVRGAMEVGQRIQQRLRFVRMPDTLPGVALIMLMVLLSVAALPRLYAHPKQDYVGAMTFVERHAAADEPIVTASGAAFPYSEYWHKPWPRVETGAQLQELRARGPRVWVVYAMRRYVAADLMQTLQRDCVDSVDFPGTLNEGEITVCHMKP